MASTPPDHTILGLDDAEFNFFATELCHVSAASNVIFLEGAPLWPVLLICISTELMYVLALILSITFSLTL